MPGVCHRLLTIEDVYNLLVGVSLVVVLVHLVRDHLDWHNLLTTHTDSTCCRGIKARDAAASMPGAASETEVAQHGGMLGASSSRRRHHRSASRQSASDVQSPTATEQDTVSEAPLEVPSFGKMLPCV